MDCAAPVRGLIRLVGIIPDAEAWDLRWAEQFRREVGADSGPQGCCACGTIVQTDLVARVSEGRVLAYDAAVPSKADPAVVRHVPWLKARVSSSALGCHSGARVYWSDTGRIIAFGSDHACIDFWVPSSDTQTWFVDPRDGQQIVAQLGETIWEIWLAYEIRCCNCYDDAPWKLTDSATIPVEGAYDFIAPPYSNSVQIHFAHFLGPSSFGIEIIDAAGNTLWSTTTTADLYAMRWPNAHALRITGAREPITVLWEGA